MLIADWVAAHSGRYWLAGVVLLAFAAAACGGDEPTAASDGEGVLGEYVWSGGLQRTYVLHLPPSYDQGEPAPLLILFHGSQEDGSNFQGRIEMDGPADDLGFITVYPDGYASSWSNQDFSFTTTLIEQLQDGLAIDENRIYIAGHSKGAELTIALACLLASDLAGAAVVSATMSEENAQACQPARPFPILFVHGTEDQFYFWSGETGYLSMNQTVATWVTANDCVGDPAVETLPDLVNDSTLVQSRTYTDCAGGAEVMLYAIQGGGHRWPGVPGAPSDVLGHISMEISSVEILEFLARHRRVGG